MPAIAGTGAAPANYSNSEPQAALTFRSNWQAQMAVLANQADGDLNGLSAEPETAGGAPEASGAAIANRAMQPAQSGSGPSLLAPSLRTAGSMMPGSQNAVRAALAGNSVPLNAGPASEGYALSVTGAPASMLNNSKQMNQAQLPVAAPTLAAPQQSAKAVTADFGTSKSARHALPAKPPKQAEGAASSLLPGAPAAFATLPAPFAAAPATVIVPAATRPLASTPSSSLPAVFEDKPQSPASFTLPVPAAIEGKPQSPASFTLPAPASETGGSPAGAIERFPGASTKEAKQLHNENSLSYFDKTPSANDDALSYFDKTPSAARNFPSEALPVIPVASFAEAAVPVATTAREGPVASASTDGSKSGATAQLIANRGGGPGSPVPLATGASSVGETPGSGQIGTPVDLPPQGLAQLQHAAVDQVHAPSGVMQQQAVPAPVSGQEINRVAPPVNPAFAPIVTSPVAAQISANPVATNGSSASPQNARRTSRGTEAIAIGTMPNHSQPPVAASAETTSNVRDSVGGPAATNPPSAQNAVSSAPSVRETFAALDADPAPGAISWTHAGARQAEAGFEDPALGWVGVRADLSGGGVHATLLPGSVEAAQALGQHMDGLNAYMAQQHTPVESLAMGAPGSRDANHSAEQGLSQGMNQGTNQGAGQGTGGGTDPGQGQNAQQQSWAAPESNSMLRTAGVDGAASAASPVQPVEPDAAAQIQGSRGVHISVVA
jgi:hypothetical protein